MARSIAKIIASVWVDDDWVALPAGAQRLYWLLLSQPRLTLIGSIDFIPARWASLAPDTTTDDIETAVAHLEAARFVLVDRETQELLIRTFTAHDMDPGRVNRNLIKGLWGAWTALSSRDLRHAAVHSIPEALWAKIEDSAPGPAVQIRRSPRLEPEEGPRFEPAVGTIRSEPPSTYHLSTATSRPTAATPTVATGTDTGPDQPDDDDRFLEAVLDARAERVHGAAKSPAWRAAVARTIDRNRLTRLRLDGYSATEADTQLDRADSGPLDLDAIAHGTRQPPTEPTGGGDTPNGYVPPGVSPSARCFRGCGGTVADHDPDCMEHPANKPRRITA